MRCLLALCLFISCSLTFTRTLEIANSQTKVIAGYGSDIECVKISSHKSHLVIQRSDTVLCKIHNVNPDNELVLAVTKSRLVVKHVSTPFKHIALYVRQGSQVTFEGHVAKSITIVECSGSSSINMVNGTREPVQILLGPTFEESSKLDFCGAGTFELQESRPGGLWKGMVYFFSNVRLKVSNALLSGGLQVIRRV